LWDFASLARLPRDLRVSLGPIVAWALESPIVAHRAYHRIDKIAQEVQHLFAFRGTRALLGPRGESMHDLYWPEARRAVDSGPPWGDRDFLVAVVSNKNSSWAAGQLSLRSPKRALRMLAAASLSRTYSVTRRWHVADLYKRRLDAIIHFAGTAGFDLYGVGWDRPPRSRRVAAPSVAAAYRGAVEDKAAILSRYRFALCYENTSFPGYITEKIFDCIFAGTIPVYLGAPDVHELIPPGVFVDARKFASAAELEAHLRSLGPGEGERYLSAAADFIGSDSFSRFRSDRFVDQVVSCFAGRR
ncbi:MAG: glycosyltransferase family 10, partial [Actinomycetota bacterium]|nr:glycosyltransferase family 10 [Actinomycetota bacterium]